MKSMKRWSLAFYWWNNRHLSWFKPKSCRKTHGFCLVNCPFNAFLIWVLSNTGRPSSQKVSTSLNKGVIRCDRISHAQPTITMYGPAWPWSTRKSGIGRRFRRLLLGPHAAPLAAFSWILGHGDILGISWDIVKNKMCFFPTNWDLHACTPLLRQVSLAKHW